MNLLINKNVIQYLEKAILGELTDEEFIAMPKSERDSFRILYWWTRTAAKESLKNFGRLLVRKGILTENQMSKDLEEIERKREET